MFKFPRKMKVICFTFTLWFKVSWKLLCELFRCNFIIDNYLTYLIAAKGEVSWNGYQKFVFYQIKIGDFVRRYNICLNKWYTLRLMLAFLSAKQQKDKPLMSTFLYRIAANCDHDYCFGNLWIWPISCCKPVRLKYR